MRALSLVPLLATVAIPTPVFAEAGDVLLRIRAVVVSPTENSGSILPTFPGEEVEVSDSFAPEVDITYMATDHIGFELIAATTKHDFTGTSGTTGGIGELGSTWVLPPTLTVQYHIAPESSVRPYIGAGINYTAFYSEDASTGLENAVGPTSVSLSDSWGWALQAGVDVDISENIFLNFDVKYIDIDTTATIRNATIGTQQVDIDLDPFVFGIGIGFRL
ncbi:OmpW family outer membrane protein [Parasphingopyxis sp.]|uniref:OmpW/AlkL family protein n=1 Tax=Parasphingopyxis sp. TaxID=1920299 RepID=UPI002625908A|nr:OmpW family outer membrane protein [Parasphingopyxis sp.]